MNDLDGGAGDHSAGFIADGAFDPAVPGLRERANDGCKGQQEYAHGKKANHSARHSATQQPPPRGVQIARNKTGAAVEKGGPTLYILVQIHFTRDTNREIYAKE